MKGFASRHALIVTVLLAFPLWGCGAATSNRVEGTVTFDGNPIESGEIRFLPKNGEGGVGAGSIENGKYSIECAPGEKNVQISATRVDAKPAPDGLENYVQYIPSKYNEKTTLTAKIEAGGTTGLDFDLEP